MSGTLKVAIVAASILVATSAFAQAPPQQPQLDFTDQLYLLSKSEAKQLDVMKEQMTEHLRHDQAVAEWWQKVWDGLDKKK